jgi:hypothetical protein
MACPLAGFAPVILHSLDIMDPLSWRAGKIRGFAIPVKAKTAET